MTIDLTLLIRRANTMRRLHQGLPVEAWYVGYARGLGRAMHGASFCTQAEHARWSAMHASRDPQRQLMGAGYLAGLQGQWAEPPSHAMMAELQQAAVY